LYLVPSVIFHNNYSSQIQDLSSLNWLFNYSQLNEPNSFNPSDFKNSMLSSEIQDFGTIFLLIIKNIISFLFNNNFLVFINSIDYTSN